MSKRTEKKLDRAVALTKAEEAMRLVAHTQLRCDLIQAARELLPDAVKLAKPNNGKPGNASLLRLISRIAMRDFKSDFLPAPTKEGTQRRPSKWPNSPQQNATRSPTAPSPSPEGATPSTT